MLGNGFFHAPQLHKDMKRTAITGSEPITLAEVKTYLGVSHSEQDDLLMDLIEQAREDLEKSINYSLVESTWEFYLSCFPQYGFKIRKAPFVSLDAFTYTDVDGVETTVPSSVYMLDTSTEPAKIVLDYNQSWPANRDWHNSIKVTFTAGWATDEYGTNWEGPQELRILLSEMVYARFHNPEWDLAPGTIYSKIPGMERVLSHYNLESHLV